MKDWKKLLAISPSASIPYGKAVQVLATQFPIQLPATSLKKQQMMDQVLELLLQASDQPSSDLSNHMGSEPVDGNLFLLLLLSINLP